MDRMDRKPEVKVSGDPAVIIAKPLHWEQLRIDPGSWRLYSVTNPTIEVVSCPA
jgi:hypothetical protein